MAVLMARIDERLLDLARQQTEQLQGFRTEMGERQTTLKQELREELLHELATSPGVSALRPTAPPFVPSVATDDVVTEDDTGGATTSAGTGTEDVTRGSGGGESLGTAAVRERAVTTPTSQQQRPAPFDGKVAWEAYRTQFELLAEMNRWSNSAKAAYLAISLRGPAVTVLTNLPPERRQDYEALTTALATRFGVTHQTELHRMRLKARTRRRDESLSELAEDIEHLVRLAYPEAADSMVEVLAKDQFVDALPEEDMRVRIRQNKPATLRDALAMALELESYQLASKQKARFVREAQLEEGQPLQQQQQQMADRRTRDAGDVLQQLVEALRCARKEPGRPRRTSSSRKEGNQSSRNNLICWECKERGHRRRECPKLQSHAQGEKEISQPGNGQ